MKPKNKFQQQVVEASKKLPPITQEHIQWAYENIIEHTGHRTDKGKITCTQCNHSWQGTGYLVDILTACNCPNCKTNLEIKTTKERIFKNNYYMTIITACEGFQVLRTVMIKHVAKIRILPEYTYSEVMQRWIAPDGKYCTFAKLRQTMGTVYYDSWIFHTDLELRQEIDVYDRIYTGAIYPKQRLIPELKRTGYKKAFYGQKPLNLFQILLTDSRAETLLKTKQMHLLKRLMDIGWKKNIEKYWSSIRICIRNNYKIKDAAMWCDYIDFLSFFNKDLHNAKYVCPTDLHKEHDRYMNKHAKAKARLELAEQLEKEAEYIEAKSRFFGLMFSDNIISVRVLESIEEFIKEGILMHHCVGNYHSKKDSLVLSATIEGKPVETVEVSLSKLEVIQCRGLCNKNTKYHKQILNLVIQNMSLIEERLSA